MEQPAPAAGDELRHEQQHRRVAVGRQAVQILEERLAEIAVGRVVDLERDAGAVTRPVGANLVGVTGAEREVDSARVLDAEGPRVIDRAH